MKKLSLLLCALMITGVTFACDGDKKCDKKHCKSKTECCSKKSGKKACCKKDAKTATTTDTKKAS